MRIRYAVSTMVFWGREHQLSFEQECQFLQSWVRHRALAEYQGLITNAVTSGGTGRGCLRLHRICWWRCVHGMTIRRWSSGPSRSSAPSCLTQHRDGPAEHGRPG